jgi:MFS family permease
MMLFESNIPFIISSVFFAIGLGTIMPLVTTLCMQRAPVKRRGAAYATLVVFNNIGLSVEEA